MQGMEKLTVVVFNSKKAITVLCTVGYHVLLLLVQTLLLLLIKIYKTAKTHRSQKHKIIMHEQHNNYARIQRKIGV